MSIKVSIGCNGDWAANGTLLDGKIVCGDIPDGALVALNNKMASELSPINADPETTGGSFEASAPTGPDGETETWIAHLNLA